MQYQYLTLAAGRLAILNVEPTFPDPNDALSSPNVLIALGGDLSPDRILQAYRMGIFPWFNPEEPILWWSPDPRFVLFPHELKISKSLKKTLKKQPYEIRFNTAFAAVIQACAGVQRPEQLGTWLSEEMQEAYCQLHAMGYAHSAEAWYHGQLVGGLYGVKIGKVFYGESMFHLMPDASKVAWVNMVQHLILQGVELIDCQMETAYLASFGARPLARSGFLQLLAKLVD